MGKYGKILIWMLAASSVAVTARTRTPEEAREIAEMHFKADKGAAFHKKGLKAHAFTVKGKQVADAESTTSAGNEPYYIFNYGSDAFVIVSGDDRMPDVLGYSDSGAFYSENMPENLKGWLGQYEKMFVRYGAGTVADDGAISLPVAEDASLPESVAPLLGGIAWNQSGPYNDRCPGGSVTGCVATAMGMVMKYYNYPKMGQGRFSYKTSMHGYSCSYDFEESPIPWKDMLDTYDNCSYTDAQAKAVADFLYSCGVAVKMDYDSYASSASALRMAQGLIQYFKYNKNMLFRLRNAYTDAEWIGIIKKELAEGRPVLYTGSSKEIGHEFVIDGYDNQGMAHINWGWGGMSNGYFDMGTLDPLNPGIGGGSADGGGYVYSQGMLTGMQPSDDGNVSENSWYMTAMLLLSQPDSAGMLPIESTIKIGAYTVANYGPVFNGEVGIGLYKYSTGELVKVLHPQQMSGIEGGVGGNLQFECVIPEDVRPGSYSMHVVAKKFSSDEWSRVRSVVGYCSYLNVIISRSKIQFYDPRVKPELSGGIKVNGPLSVNKYGDFTVTVKNDGEEFYFGEVGVMIIPSTESDDMFYCTDEMRLSPGEEKTINISKVLVGDDTYKINPGESKICGIYSYGEALFPLTDFEDITVEYAKPPKLVLDGALVVNDIPASESGFISIPLHVACEGEYNNFVVAAIFDYGATTTNRTLGLKLNMTDGEERDIKLEGEISPALKEGKYLVGIYYYDITTQAYSGEMGFATFEVTDGSGIEAIGNDDIRISTEGGVMRIFSNGPVQGVTVTDAGGRTVFSVSPSVNVPVEIAGLQKGVYIVTVVSGDRKISRKTML